MDSLDALITALGLKVKVVIASAMGAFISLRFFDGLNWWERWTTFLGGCALGSWCTSLVINALGVSERLEAPAAIIVGVFGMAVVSAIIKVIKDTDWIGVMKSVLGGKFGGDK